MAENDAFIASLPEEYRTNPTFHQYKDLGALLKSHVSLESMMGADKNLIFKLPKAGDYSEVYTKLGKPESADKYEFPKELKVKLPDAFQASLRKVAHEANLTQAQLEKLIQFQDTEAATMLESSNRTKAEAKAAAETAIKTQFGNAYDQRINLAKNVFEAFGRGDAWKALEDAGLTTNPALMGMLSDIGAFMGEDTLVSGGGAGGPFNMSPDAAKAEINKHLGNPKSDFMLDYTNASRPGHKAAVTEMERLYKIAHG